MASSPSPSLSLSLPYTALRLSRVPAPRAPAMLGPAPVLCKLLVRAAAASSSSPCPPAAAAAYMNKRDKPRYVRGRKKILFIFRFRLAPALPLLRDKERHVEASRGRGNGGPVGRHNRARAVLYGHITTTSALRIFLSVALRPCGRKTPGCRPEIRWESQPENNVSSDPSAESAARRATTTAGGSPGFGCDTMYR